MAADDGDQERMNELRRYFYEQSTFRGRLRHFLDVIDPRTLLTSSKQLEYAIKLLDDYKNGNLPAGVTDEQLWKAQKIKQAIIHPDTGEKIFMPFRMSAPSSLHTDNSISAPISSLRSHKEDISTVHELRSTGKDPSLFFVSESKEEVSSDIKPILTYGSFVPFGSFIVVGLLLPNPTLKQIVFWQWLNQSHNACVNYANRNATKPTPVRRFVLGYVGAVTAAVSIAVGLSVLINRASRFGHSTKVFIQRFVPFPAVATASTCNVLLMRNSELYEGIEVVDKNNKVVGTSKVAAKKALAETALTRMFLPAPILLIPPVIMSFLEKRQFLIRNPRLHLPINAVVCTLAFGFALPVAIALFPQMSEIHGCKLEPEIQEATSEDVLCYNKGL